MESNPTIVFPEPRKVVIEERPVPAPGPDALLVQTRRTLISTGTELTILSGDYPENSIWHHSARYPFLPGYDNIGEVVDVGQNVDRKWLGTKVASYGIHARYATLPAVTARPIHVNIADDHAAFFTIAEIVMNGIRRGQVTWGETVAVFGLGLLGQLAVQFCRLCGARSIVAVDLADWRLLRLSDRPSVVPVNASTEDVGEITRSATHGRMADVAFEITGDPSTIPNQVRVLRKQGRFVILSSPRGPCLFDFHDLCNSPSYTIIGAHNSSHPQAETLNNPWTNHRHAELFFDLVADGRLDVGRLISHRLPYSDAPRCTDNFSKIGQK